MNQRKRTPGTMVLVLLAAVSAANAGPEDALNAAWTQAEKIKQGVSAVRGVSGGGYPVSLVVGESFVKGEAYGGYPVDLSIDRSGNACLIEGTFHGGFRARVRLDYGRARGVAMGGYPVDLTVSETAVTGVVQGGYPVNLAVSSGGVQGAAMGGYPLKLELTRPVDACRLTAALLPVIHKPLGR